MAKLSEIEKWGQDETDPVIAEWKRPRLRLPDKMEAKRLREFEASPPYTTILLDIPFLKLKKVLELLSQAGKVSVEGTDDEDCDGDRTLLVRLD